MSLPTIGFRDELLSNLKAAYARMWVRIKGGNREATHFIAEVFLPVLTIGAYVILYRSLGLPSTLGSAVILGGAMIVFIYTGFFAGRTDSASLAALNGLIGFVVLGGVMIAFWMNVLWNMSAQWYWEKEMGNLEMYMVAPVSRMAILFGMSLGGMINTSIRALGILILGVYVFQVPFQLHDIFTASFIFLLTVVALYSLGMVFASLYMLYGREVWHTNQLLMEPVFFLSGSYFPSIYISAIPFWVQLAATAIPMTVGLDAIRRIAIYGGDISTVWLHIVALIAFILVLFPLARKALNFMESLGKKEGRLTLRWQ